jgi:hypothetical protein
MNRDSSGKGRSEFPTINSESVLDCFFKLERRLIADENLGNCYSAAINEYINLGHARKISAEEPKVRPIGRTWILPNHPVINPKKPEKCRPVFDASAFYKGASLNSALVKGPDLLTNLIGVLILVALSANSVMIHQVKVRPQGAGPSFLLP